RPQLPASGGAAPELEAASPPGGVSLSVLMIFVDGVGLGPADPRRNPLAAVPMPVIRELTGGRPLVASSAENPGEGPGLTDAFPAADGRPAGAEAPPARRPARLVAVDACLGDRKSVVEGKRRRDGSDAG